MVDFKRVALDTLHTVWPLAMPLIREALDRSHGERYPEHVLQELEQEETTLWVGFEGNRIVAAAVTYFVCYPNYRSCVIGYYADTVGEHKGPTVFMTLMEDWARVMGCHKVEVIGRPGWKKLGAPYGYQQEYVKIGKWV